jgi:hypothetical protein
MVPFRAGVAGGLGAGLLGPGLLGAALLIVMACSTKTRPPSAETRSTGPSPGSVSTAGEPARPNAFANVRFRPYPIVDREQHGLVLGTMSVPSDWTADSKIAWDYSSGNLPARLSARLSAPDGSAWVEVFPAELFDWVQPEYQRTRPGTRNFGMIYYPHINVQIAMKNFVIARYRGNVQNLKVIGFRPIANLARLLGKPPIEGDSLAARISYTVGGHVVDEEFFCLLAKDQPIASHSPVGTGYEHHRVLAYVHSLGARDGKLESLHPLLGFIASSLKDNPAWQDNLSRIQREIGARFNKQIARNYQQIAAAGARSRQISAQSDAFLARVDAERVASNQASASQRAAASQSGSFDKANDDFDQYIRGTEKMEDPYWGTSERSYNNQYHWTDGFGNYQDTNDATFDPNQHSNGNWQRMQPAK